MGKELQAYKFSRTSLERIDELVISNKFSEEIESLSMSIRAKPFKDDEELLPLCYRCSHHNPLMNPKGNDCTNCGQPYVFSFASFELLPLVEFILPDKMSDEEALALIDQVPNSLFEKDANARFVAASAAAAGMNMNKSS
jgi:intraflagellar transport protein 122